MYLYRKYKLYLNFIAAGVITTIIDLLILTLCVEVLHFNVIISTLLSQSVAILINYFITAKYVFEPGKRGTKVEISMVYILSGFGFFLNIFLMWFFVYFLGVYYIISRIISIGVNVVINFQVKKRIIFVK